MFRIKKLQPWCSLAWVCLMPLIASAMVGCRYEETDGRAKGTNNGEGTVTLSFEFEDGRDVAQVGQKISGPIVVEDLLRLVKSPEIKIRGSRTTAFVHSIDGVSINGSKGWLYQINDKWAVRGIGQVTVVAGDKVSWHYGDFRSQMTSE